MEKSGKLIDLDYRTMKGLNETHEGTPAQWLPLYQSHPELWTILVDKPKNIIGYWHFVALFDDDFELAKLGQILDKDITVERIRFLEMPGRYKLYFICISLLPQYRSASGYNVLFNSIFKKLTDLMVQDIYVEEICANAFTPEGQSLCKSIGMQHVCDHIDEGKIFHIKLFPLPNLRILKRFPELVDNYGKESNRFSL
jgi:hypothetical protein